MKLPTLDPLLAAALLAFPGVAQVTLPTSIDDTSFGPLKTGVTYVASADVFVTANQTLTIQPGVVIKFASPQAEFFVRNGATLNAIGTRTNPIVLTSIHDDSVGVKLGTRLPAAGDWDDLEFDNGGGVLQFVEVRYAGVGNDPSVVLNRTSVVFRDCVVRDGAGDGIHAFSGPTLERCAIRDCPGDAIDRVDFANLPNMRDNVASGMGRHTLRVASGSVLGDVSVGPENGINNEIYLATQVQASNATITVRGGLIFKTASQIAIAGTGSLQVQGLANRRVVFTSPADDTVGNDTLGDGPTVGSPGDWPGVYFQLGATGTSSVANADIRFAGSDGGQRAAVAARGGTVSLLDCVIDSSKNDGLQLANSQPTVQRCAIRNCGGRAIHGAALAALPRFRGNTASGCGGGSTLYTLYFNTGTAPLLTSARIGPDNGLNSEIVVTNIDVRGADVVLTLDPGLVVKFVAGVSVSQGARIESRGTATQPVVFTSLNDDSVGTDSRGDGPTTGSPGDWSFVNLFTSGNEFTGTVFRFGGAGFSNGAVVVVQGGQVATFRGCVFEKSSQYGLNLLDGTARGVVVEDCQFLGNAMRPFLNLNWDELPFLLDNRASGNGTGDHLQVQGQATSRSTSITMANTLNGNGIIVCNGVSTSTGNAFQVGPGIKLKMLGGSLSGGGRLVLDGRGDKPIVITSSRDDTVGGDTNLDGNATVPVPGDWGAVQFGPSSSGSVAHVHARYGGGGFSGVGTFVCNNGQVRITSARADFSLRSGFYIDDVMSPAANWIAYKCESVGINLRGNLFTVQHATATENKGIGIFSPGPYGGVVYSSISWNNARRVTQDNFVNVRHTKCNGSLEKGNIHADPMFADVAGGDLHISPFSLCVGRGDLPQATLWGVDYEGNSRILDHALNGLALPDIGAYEVYQYRMGIDSELRIGRTTNLTIFGPGPKQGSQVLVVGPAIGGEFLPPFGVLITGTLATTLIMSIDPTGTPYPLAVPDDKNLIGVRLGLQTLVITDGSIPAGGLTNALLATIGR